MTVRTLFSFKRAIGVVLAVAAAGASAQDGGVVNVYNARHYPSDEALFAGFTKSTGIRIQRVDSDDAGILARLKAEGAGSPADVVLLVDASRLWRADADGLFQPVKSRVLAAAIPETLHAPAGADGGVTWWGLSTRARIVVYDKARVKREDVDTYEELADPKHRGRLCIRSGSHPYNLSLFGAMLEHQGAARTEEWLKGLVANMARAPKGGDTDQIKAVASGECAVAVTNTYYLARLMRSGKAEDQAVVDQLGVVFPNQSTTGTHVNVAGGAMARHAKNPAGALRFLEYLASPEAQSHFANGNNEWPAARGLTFENRALASMSGGSFKSEVIPVARVGRNQAQVQQMLDRAGFK